MHLHPHMYPILCTHTPQTHTLQTTHIYIHTYRHTYITNSQRHIHSYTTNTHIHTQRGVGRRETERLKDYWDIPEETLRCLRLNKRTGCQIKETYSRTEGLVFFWGRWGEIALQMIKHSLLLPQVYWWNMDNIHEVKGRLWRSGGWLAERMKSYLGSIFLSSLWILIIIWSEDDKNLSRDDNLLRCSRGVTTHLHHISVHYAFMTKSPQDCEWVLLGLSLICLGNMQCLP